MSRAKILNLVLLATVISGCSIFEPYVDRRRNPGTSDVSKLYTGMSKEDAPAICYNQLLTTDEELQTMADEECLKNHAGTRAEFVEKDGFSCKILLPATAYYKCVK